MMQFCAMVELLHTLENISSRNAITELLAEFLKEIDASEIREVCYLLLGQLGPLYARVDFGMAEKMVVRALENMDQGVWKKYKEMGDLGEVAEHVREQYTVGSNQQLEAREVYVQLMGIAQANGEGSQERKVTLLSELLKQASPKEARYVVRMVLGKMRLGFSDKTILDALSVMDGGSKAGRDLLDNAYQVSPDIGTIAQLVKRYGVTKGAAQVNVMLGTPVIPALAQRLKGAGEMIAKMGTVACEPKYDGTRIQIHYRQGEVKTFTRSLEENSAMFPELATIDTQIKAEDIILDCEAVGYDPATGRLLPFQETITRKRKHGVEAMSKTIPIRFFCFDVLYMNGKSMLAAPWHERRAVLEQVITAGNVLMISPVMVTDSVEALQRFHKEQLAAGLEGAMVKKHDGEYQPGRTGWNWVKFKEVEEAEGKLADTIDGIVMGYYRGKGKRHVFGIGAFLFGVLNEKNNSWMTVAKIGTGLTDDQWREIKRRADACFAMERPDHYQVAEGLTPDVWVDPMVVVEVAADEITHSPLHSSGFGLRFPRLVKFRDDKLPEQATTTEEVETIRQASTLGK